MYLDTHKRFPHLANGFKYCFALVIVVIGATHGSWKQLSPTGTSVITDLWIATYAISTAYTYSWDVFMDWGLYFKEGRPYVFACEKLRRDRRMVSTDSWLPYYAAVAADAFLRFLWTLTLAPSSMPFGSFVQVRPPPDDCPNLSALPADPPSRAASRHRMGYPLRMRPARPSEPQDNVTPVLSYAEVFRRAMWSAFRVENEHLNNTLGYKRAEVVPLHFERPAPASADEKTGTSLLAVVLEVALFIGVVLLVYIVSYLTHQ